MELKEKKCKYCELPFKPFRTLQTVCSPSCGIDLFNERNRKKKAKEWRAEKKERKAALKTNSDYVRELQVVFNTFIRLRDKDRLCISCTNELKGKYDAGHYHSVGSYPELRFNEDNVFGQCVHCNQHKRGNLIEYTINLPVRIGKKRFDKLTELKNKPRKYTVDELKGLKTVYRLKIKQIEDKF